MRCWLRCLLCTPGVSGTLDPGYRNEFHASLQQALGKYVVFSGEYIWKYTHNAFDFSVLGNTPITFPIDWHNSKIPGYALHVEVPNFHSFSAYSSCPRWPRASSRRRWPELELPLARADIRSASTTTKSSTRPRTCSTRSPDGRWVNGLWGGFNWRYDSGLVAGSVPCYNVTDPNSLCNPSTAVLPSRSAASPESI